MHDKRNVYHKKSQTQVGIHTHSSCTSFIILLGVWERVCAVCLWGGCGPVMSASVLWTGIL